MDPQIQQRGVPIALITDKGLSPVRPFADIIFHCATDSNAFLPCYTGCIALIDVICQAVCMEHVTVNKMLKQELALVLDVT